MWNIKHNEAAYVGPMGRPRVRECSHGASCYDRTERSGKAAGGVVRGSDGWMGMGYDYRLLYPLPAL